MENVVIDSSDSYEVLIYNGRLGKNFDTALDSLLRMKDISNGSIQKTPIDVIFDCDNRLFYGIIIDYCGNYSDVIDTKGYYYNRTWTPTAFPTTQKW